MTRMLLTSIPYFREVIIMSFRCEHCGNHNTEIQSAGEIQREFITFQPQPFYSSSSRISLSAKGCTYSVHILNAKDLNRQLVKSPTCTITIPELSLTLPASRGQLTNVEGLISDIVRDLSLDQPVRKIMDPETFEKIETLVNKLKECLDDDDEEKQKEEEKQFTPFTLKLDDPSGNSFVQFYGTTGDAQWSLRAYNRTREQNVALGLVAEEEEQAQPAAIQNVQSSEEAVGAIDGSRPSVVEREDGTVVPEEVYRFPGSCSSCGHTIDTMMQRVNIPHFKVSVVLLLFVSLLWRVG
jgi:zinc finger protein